MVSDDLLSFRFVFQTTLQQEYCCQSQENQKTAGVRYRCNQHRAAQSRVAAVFFHDDGDKYADRGGEQEVQRHRGDHHQADADAAVQQP